MAFLARARKCDLLVAVDELNLIAPENAKVIQLTDLITKDANYNEDMVKNLLARIASEREEIEAKIKLEKEEAQIKLEKEEAKNKLEKEENDKREYELKKLELELASGRKSDSVITPKDPNLLKLMNRYEMQGDISVYLGLFERQIKRMSVAKENWVTYLLGLLPLEIVNIVSREPEILSNDYDHIKKVLLNRFRLSPEQFRQRFFAHRKENLVPWREYAFELTSFLEEWVIGLEISTFDNLKELLVVDQIRRKLPIEIREHFVDDLPKITKIDDLINKLDDYESARNNLKKVGGPKYSDTGKSHANEIESNRYYGRNNTNRVQNNFSRNRTVAGKNYYSAPKTQDQLQGNNRNLKCFTCGELSHKSINCPRRKDGPVCFRCNTPGHKSDVCPLKDAKAVNSNSSNPNKIMKSVRIKNKIANALVDSGSEVCMVSYNFYVALGSPELTKNSVKLSGISGSAVAPLGLFSAEISVDNFVIKIDFYVLENLNNTVILGSNFLSKLNFVMNKHGLSITGIRENNASENDISVNYACVIHSEEKYVSHSEDRHSNSNGLGISLMVDNYFQKNTKDCEISNSVEELNLNSVIDRNEAEFVYLAETANAINLNEIDLSHVLDKNTKNEVRHIIQNYVPNKTKTTNLEMTLNLTDEIPIAQRPRRLAYIEQKFVEDQIREWLRDGIIRESNSNFASPIVLAKKKNDQFRLCIDYRKLNRKIIRNHYPLPLIEDILDKIEQAQVFTSLDLKNGFFHVGIEENSKKYTSFVTHHGQFEFNKVPFGLSVSPQTFQRYICAVYRELIADGTILVYMDDLIIPAQSEEEGMMKLKRVLEVAAEYGLQFNFAKCQFLKRKIEFLGYVIEDGTIRPSETKILAVKKFPEPTNVKQLQSFLGLTGYFRKYIAGYAKIAYPLSDLLKSENKFSFGFSQKEAFNVLKEKLANQPILHIFKRGSKLELHTDASSLGFGAVLMQQADDGTLHPIHYMSRKTTPTQSKFCSYELETLAVIEALKKFRNYLLGNKIKIVTDCSAFQKTLDKKDLTPKIARWALFLQQFDYEIVHRSGKQMKHVDALSRNAVMLVTRSFDELSAKVKLAQQEDEYVQTIKRLMENNECNDYFIRNDIVYKYENDRELLVIPTNMQSDLIRSVHNQGHHAVAKTESIIKENYFIPRLRKLIENVIINCVECILCNRKRGKGEGLLHPIPKQSIPLHTYHIDHIGPMPSTNKQYNHIFTVVDSFTKFVWLYPVKSTTTKEVLSKLKLQSDTFGNPVRIISDKGTAFTSNDFQMYCQEENIEHIAITTGIPRGNGQVERIHEILIPILAKLSIEDATKWYKYVAAVQKIINSTISRSTKYSPFELLTGVKLRHKSDIKIKELLEEEYLNTIMTERDLSREIAKENILRIQEENRKTYNKKRKLANTYKVGDIVAIQRSQLGPGMKLKIKFLGPYQVIKVKNNDRYDVQKVGCHEGPTLTSSAADCMKSWSNT